MTLDWIENKGGDGMEGDTKMELLSNGNWHIINVLIKSMRAIIFVLLACRYLFVPEIFDSL